MLRYLRETQAPGDDAQQRLGHLRPPRRRSMDRFVTLDATTLYNLEIPTYLIANALVGVVSQRLARRICPTCSKPHAPTPAELDSLGLGSASSTKSSFRRGSGCAECLATGYRGRIGLFEVLSVDTKMRELILEQSGKQVLQQAAERDGMQTLRENAVEKIVSGATTPEEYLKNM